MSSTTDEPEKPGKASKYLSELFNSRSKPLSSKPSPAPESNCQKPGPKAHQPGTGDGARGEYYDSMTSTDYGAGTIRCTVVLEVVTRELEPVSMTEMTMERAV
jgi:hypothetical protein